MKLIVGLGNPGRGYRKSRHNVGFCLVDELARRWSLDLKRRKFDGIFDDSRYGDEPVSLLKPETYMNCSGQAVRDLTSFYKVPPAGVLIVMDDLALPPGRLRIRPGGSSGGHKGLGDIAAAMGTDAIARLRVGIGSPPGRMDAAAYVLRRFDEDEKELIGQAVALATRAAEEWLCRPIDELMETYNAPRQERKSADESKHQDV